MAKSKKITTKVSVKENQEVESKETKREIALKNMKKANIAKKGTALFYRQGWHKTFIDSIMGRYGGIEAAANALPEEKALEVICKAAHEGVKNELQTQEPPNEITQINVQINYGNPVQRS